jgi:hypothetical protein
VLSTVSFSPPIALIPVPVAAAADTQLDQTAGQSLAEFSIATDGRVLPLKKHWSGASDKLLLQVLLCPPSRSRALVWMKLVVVITTVTVDCADVVVCFPRFSAALSRRKP